MGYYQMLPNITEITKLTRILAFLTIERRLHLWRLYANFIFFYVMLYIKLTAF